MLALLIMSSAATALPFSFPQQWQLIDPRRLTEQREGLGTNPILGVLSVSAFLTTAAAVAVLLARRAVPEAAPIAPAQHTCCALHGGTQVQDVLLGEAAPKWDCESPPARLG